MFQSTVNCASLLIVFLGPFFGFDFPLTLIQLLWVNLVMDTLAAMAFGGEPALTRYSFYPSCSLYNLTQYKLWDK